MKTKTTVLPCSTGRCPHCQSKSWIIYDDMVTVNQYWEARLCRKCGWYWSVTYTPTKISKGYRKGNG